ncbi:hypothetical protein RRG08_065243 [Elysia crispata]|uniref:Uncharacterized protein n=1 Tax=Elysia crispata TaxID=231223 RepID=A0AAE0YI03_9GAST|nr:hypothetical protein RRG08_065243 [Elysia crispata]
MNFGRVLSERIFPCRESPRHQMPDSDTARYFFMDLLSSLSQIVTDQTTGRQAQAYAPTCHTPIMINLRSSQRVTLKFGQQRFCSPANSSYKLNKSWPGPSAVSAIAYVARSIFTINSNPLYCL